MKKLTSILVPFAMFLVQSMAAQQAAAPVDRPPEPNMVFDDDGGKVQIVPADLAASPQKTFHGGAVMKSAQQVSIFLGSGWADAQVGSRKPSLADVTAATGDLPFAEVRSRNVRVLRAAPHVEDFGNLGSRPLNDLDIQRKLSQMLESKAIPAPTAATIYVVFLAPEASSTLGGHSAGADYAAYHNVVNLEAGEIRYVVVPFHQDAQKHAAATARAFAETALNPNGQGWF
ncbi:MAG TPA: hypothetical protein VFR84_02520 [Candidatus Angelobacter sp.]|nr:hypothetical protein [Candidatus Angelobacter sp.]